jgi:RNA polymerase sigma factor (sigma-70 family)
MRTWLSNIAHNEMVNLLRQKNFFSRNGIQYMDESDEDGMFDDGIRQMHYRLDEDESRSTGVFGKEATREALLRLELVTDAISSLSKKDQSVIFMLREDLSRKEIADALGVKETAQRKHAFDMRGRLRKCLDGKHYAAIQEHSDKYLKSTVRLENLVEQQYQFEASRSEMDGLLPLYA